MDVTERAVRVLVPDHGKSPFEAWLATIRDKTTRQRIQARLTRLQTGNFGDFHGVGKGVFELRISFGPGYRVYFGFQGDTIIILLGGGDKSTQSGDIRNAQGLWEEYHDALEGHQRDVRG
jgi:putative addiction module killer protein